MADRPAQFRPTRPKGKKFNPRRSRDNLYDRSWEKYRRAFLSVNPKCYACGKKATVVDHLRVHKGDESLFKQLDNHIPLCARDHNYITAKFDHKEGKQDLDGKLRFLADKRVKTETSTTVKVLKKYG